MKMDSSNSPSLNSASELAPLVSSKAQDPVQSLAQTLEKNVREGRYNNPKLKVVHTPSGRLLGLEAWDVEPEVPENPSKGVTESPLPAEIYEQGSGTTMSYKNKVATAFDRMLEAVENIVEGLNLEGAEAFQKADYERAEELTKKGSQIKAFQERVSELQKEWRTIFPVREDIVRGDEPEYVKNDREDKPEYVETFRRQLKNPDNLISKIRKYIDENKIVIWKDLKRVCVEKFGYKSEKSGTIGASVRVLVMDKYVKIEGRGNSKRIVSLRRNDIAKTQHAEDASIPR